MRPKYRKALALTECDPSLKQALARRVATLFEQAQARPQSRHIILSHTRDGAYRFYQLSWLATCVYDLAIWDESTKSFLPIAGLDIEGWLDILEYCTAWPTGTLYGYHNGDGRIMILIDFVAGAKTGPPHSFMIRRHGDLAKADWPDFVGIDFFGDWFWKLLAAGNIVCLDEALAAAEPDQILVEQRASSYWVIRLAHPLPVSVAIAVPRGVFFYYDTFERPLSQRTGSSQRLGLRPQLP